MTTNSPYLTKLIQRALDTDVINAYADLPFYKKETDSISDEVSQIIWLEQKVGIDAPTLTLPTELVSELIGNNEFRLILTRAAITEIISRHSAAFEEWFVQALDSMKKTGYGFTILNSYLCERVKAISINEVDNYLRINYTEITKAVYAAVDEKLQKTIEETVQHHLNHMKKRIERS